MTLTGAVAEPAQPGQHYLRNIVAFFSDTAFFNVALTLISATTVMPSFLSTLTRSEVIIGMAGGITSAAWLLPQIFVASMTARQALKKPAMLRAAWLARPVLPLMALFAWRLAVPAPALTVALSLACLFTFFLCDAFCSIPWFDIVARALPHRRRGTVMGAGQVVGSLGGMGVGFLVRYALGPSSRWAYPANYAVLFLLSGLLFAFAAVALTFVHEPPPALPQKATPSMRQVLALMPVILKGDRAFRRLVAVKVIVGCVGGAGAFYVLHATRHLGFRVEDAGTFVSAQVAGSMTAGMLLGLVQSRWGPLVHIRLMIALSAVSPLLALVASALHASGTGTLLYVFVAIYFFLGIYMSGLSWPFFNWIMEYAAEDRRPLYFGLMNTLTAVVMVAPAVAGWIARSVSYPAAFAGALALALLAMSLSSTLTSTRHNHAGATGKSSAAGA